MDAIRPGLFLREGRRRNAAGKRAGSLNKLGLSGKQQILAPAYSCASIQSSGYNNEGNRCKVTLSLFSARPRFSSLALAALAVSGSLGAPAKADPPIGLPLFCFRFTDVKQIDAVNNNF
jgi:hypothetical protein